MRKAIAFAAFFGMASAAGAITVETTDFITTPTARNGFEAIPPQPNLGDTFDGSLGHTEQGITVTYVGGSGGIWTGSQPAAEGTQSWYPDGGDTGYTRISFGGAVDAVEFRAGSGFLTGSINLFYDLRFNGASIGSGNAGSLLLADQGFSFYGFSGATFDEVWLQAHAGNAFSAGTFEALALDDVQIGGGTGAVPEPASWALLIAGFGLVGAASRRRRVAMG